MHPAARTWFAFSVCGASPGRVLHFDIHNLKFMKLFKYDMRPVYRYLPSKPEWERLPLASPHTGGKTKEFVLHVCHRMDSVEGDALHIAFCFPYSYGDLQARLAWLDSLFWKPTAAVLPTEHVAAAAAAAVESCGVTGASPRAARNM